MKQTGSQYYQWQAPSPIASVVVEPADKGRYKLRLQAQASVTDSRLPNLPRLLHKYGFEQAYADVWHDHNILVIPHVKDPQKLIEWLNTNGYVKGPAQQTTASDNQPKASLIDSVRKDSLQWSGKTGLVGHAAFIASGVIQKDWNRVLAGPMGASTAAILAKYGNGKENIDFDTMLGHMHDYFSAEGLDIPKLDTPEKKKGILHAAERILATHPIPIAYTVGSVGAYQVIRSGLEDMRKSGGANGRSRLLAGTTSLLGNMVVMFVPEKKKTKEERDKEKKQSWGDWFSSLPNTMGRMITHPQEIPGAFWNFLRESPLRFNGLLNFSDNFLYVMDAFGEQKKLKQWAVEHPGKITEKSAELKSLYDKPAAPGTISRIGTLEGEIRTLESQYKLARSPAGKLTPYFSMVTALSFACATFLSTISSKNRDSSFTENDDYERLYALVSKVLIQMPADRREDALGRMANYLSTHEDLKDGDITSKKLVEEVHKRLKLMESSPWLDKTGSHTASLSPASPTSGTVTRA